MPSYVFNPNNVKSFFDQQTNPRVKKGIVRICTFFISIFVGSPEFLILANKKYNYYENKIPFMFNITSICF